MRINATYSDNLDFTMEGFLEGLEADKLPKDPKKRIKTYFQVLNHTVTQAVKEAADIRASYLKALSNDNRISSQERIELIRELDELTVAIIKMHEALRLSTYLNKVQGSYHEDKVEEFHYPQIKMIINEKTGKFTINGKLKNSDIDTNQKFSEWHDQRFIKNIKDMLYKFHESIADQVLTSDELDELYKEISSVIYDAILMRYMIQHCLVNV